MICSHEHALILILTILGSQLVAVKSGCTGGWKAFGNEKCFKILDSFVDKEEAVELCSQEQDDNINQISPILEIKSIEEQVEIATELFNETQIFDGVWLGASRDVENNFNWADGSPLDFQNWDEGYPINDTTFNCTQLMSTAGKLGKSDAGLWHNVPCSKRNIPVCQKRNLFSLEELQTIVIALQNNPVPLGFIYVQLPNNTSPQILWPQVTWQNVTDSFAGLFFRVAGGTSAPFGGIQAESSNLLSSASGGFWQDGDALPPAFSVSVPASGNSDRLFSGYMPASGTAPGREWVTFQNSGNETRPRNAAVLVWKRI